MQRSLEVRIVSQSLELGIQRRDRRFVALETTEGHEYHTILEVCDLDAASVVLKLDLASDVIDIMIGEGSMQVYSR